MRAFWFNAFEFIAAFPADFLYTEQFANSAYSTLVDKNEVDKYFEPMFAAVQRGIQQKIIKDVPHEILQIFMFYPVLTLANPRLCESLDCSNKNIESAFNMAWDAIRL
jgi:hypothetical protein